MYCMPSRGPFLLFLYSSSCFLRSCTFRRKLANSEFSYLFFQNLLFYYFFQSITHHVVGCQLELCNYFFLTSWKDCFQGKPKPQKNNVINVNVVNKKRLILEKLQSKEKKTNTKKFTFYFHFYKLQGTYIGNKVLQ